MRPGQDSRDSSPIAVLSFAHLLATSIITWRIFKARAASVSERGWRAPHVVWALIAAGFLYFGIDEVGRIHENTSLWIYRGLGWERSALSSRLDDLLVGSYGVIGAAVVWRCRAELRICPQPLPLLSLGLVLMFAMVALDLITHRDDVVRSFIADPEDAKRIRQWLAVGEEQFKILAEGVFLASFWHCYRSFNIKRSQPLAP
jgi:hypothetical protein